MSKIRIANAPCSWGSLEFGGLGGETVDYARMLDELAETGYEGTELGDWGYMPTEPEELHEELARREITLLGAFVPIALKDASAHEAGEAGALRVARLLSAVSKINKQDHLPFVVLADDNGTDPVRTQHAGRVTPAMALDDGEWTTFARGGERIARAVRDETGLRTVFHHHAAGHVETPEEIARLLDATDPELLSLVFDTGHYAYGAGTNDDSVVLDGLDRFAGRIRYVHFKDCQGETARRAQSEAWDYFEAVRRGVFCELGKGVVDFPAVLERLRRCGYGGWAVVEQDVLPGMGTPKDSARRNREYLRSLGV